MRYQAALLIGRFQPFHFGHLYLIKKTLEIAEKIIIGIGSAGIFDENNPLDDETREKIIRSVFYKEKIEDKLIKIVPLEDFFDDKKWLDNLVKKVGKFDIVVSNNNWTNKIMEEAGFKVKRFPYFRRELYEGWRIRKLIRENENWQDRVPVYIKNQISKIKNTYQKSNIFEYIVVGGTFDRLHLGHKILIRKAFEIGKKVLIGISTKVLYKDKLFFQSIESFSVRKKSVSDFLVKNGWHKRAKIVSISDFTGGADKIKNIEAIIVSKNTYYNALKINELRAEKKLNPLRIIIVKDVLAEDGKLLSSERIRAGEIDREGKNYEIQNLNNRLNLKSKIELVLPEKMRQALRKPLGRIFKNTDELLQYFKTLKWLMLIAVGDIIVEELIKKGIDPDVKIIDFRSRRKKIKRTLFPEDCLSKRQSFFPNKAGTINIKTAKQLKKLIINAKGWLVIDGEEDLLTLPAILFAPLGSLVLYGHWQYGAIAVEVTEKIKQKIAKIIYQFT